VDNNQSKAQNSASMESFTEERAGRVEYSQVSITLHTMAGGNAPSSLSRSRRSFADGSRSESTSKTF
jgi:hypothetical protein